MAQMVLVVVMKRDMRHFEQHKCNTENSFIKSESNTHADCKRNMKTERTGRMDTEKSLRLHLCVCTEFMNLRNTSEATFWSEPCRTDLHSKGKQHSNMWETERKKWLWEEGEGPFS